ncbi:MAG: DUF3772 domain-containing protein, partial [Shimia sp.]
MRALLCALFLALWGVVAIAQDAINYAAWSDTAQAAETALVQGTASDEALAEIRGAIADFRAQFNDAQQANAARIATLQAQIAALGPVPEEGASEPAEIAARRVELQLQLDRLEVPRRQAEEAFSRADGIIAEIDSTLRERQGVRLFEVGPNPVNPANWGPAFADLRDSWRESRATIRAAWSDPARRAAARAELPLTLLLFAVATLLILRARVLIETLSQRIETSDSSAATSLAGLVLSFGQI